MIIYDRYVARANPWSLDIRTQRFCIQMVLASYLGGLINSLTHTIGLLDFCGLIVNHSFWDIPLLLRLSCSDIRNKEMLLLIFSGVAAMFICIIIVGSYMHIIIAICESIQLRGGTSLFHLCFPPDLCDFILWLSDLWLNPAKFSVVPATEGLCCVLYFGTPRAKPTDL